MSTPMKVYLSVGTNWSRVAVSSEIKTDAGFDARREPQCPNQERARGCQKSVGRSPAQPEHHNTETSKTQRHTAEPHTSSELGRSTVSVLTATTLAHATGAGIPAAAGTRLALQLLLHSGFGSNPSQTRLTMNRYRRAASARHCLSNQSVAIGQFARLLSALAAVAVSQAASPESNPGSPLPVKATAVLYTAVEADRSETCTATQRCPGAVWLPLDAA